MNNAFANFDERSRYSQMFLENVPSALVLDIPRMIIESTRNAWQHDPGLLNGKRRDKFPIDRLAYVETGLYGLGQKYGRHGVTAMECLNKGNNYHHTELISGHVVVIASAVEDENDKPRQAVFRNSLAIRPQAVFANFGIEVVPGGDALLAVILYGPRSAYPTSFDAAAPGFVVARFPYHDWSGWDEGCIDLLARLRDDEQDSARGPEVRRDEDVE